MNINKLVTVGMMSLMALVNVGCTAVTVTQAQGRRYVESERNLNHMYGSVVAFVKENRSGRLRSYCTGFYVRRDLIASAAHCFATPDPDMPFLDRPGVVGARHEFHTYTQYINAGHSHEGPANTATLTAINEEQDVALLSTDAVSRDFLTINTVRPAIGAMVYSMGQPGGLPWVLTQGIVSQFEFNGETNVVESILATPGIYFGNSGGPLIDNNGCVIGVAGAVAFRQPIYGIFYPISNIVRLSPSLLVTRPATRQSPST